MTKAHRVHWRAAQLRNPRELPIAQGGTYVIEHRLVGACTTALQLFCDSGFCSCCCCLPCPLGALKGHRVQCPLRRCLRCFAFWVRIAGIRALGQGGVCHPEEHRAEDVRG